MTLNELSQLYYLNREIELDQKRLDELRADTGHLGSPSFSGTPHGSGNSSPVENEAIERRALEALIEAKKARCTAELLRLETYIQSIEDSLTRQIFTYRFVNGLSWRQVAEHIGGYNTDESVKKSCYRYLNARNAAEKAAAKSQGQGNL